jgi:hypothetical protein
MNIVPSIGASGLYTLLTPFDTALTPNTEYTCQSIRLLSDIVAGGEDPYSLYYQGKSISEASYETDLAAGVSIITLQSVVGDLVSVPSSYLAAYPSSTGINYRAMMIAVSLGAVPDTLDVSAVQTEIEQLVYGYLGVKVATKLVAVSKPQMLDQDTHATLEAIRKNQASVNLSSYAQVAQLQATVTTLQNRITDLEAFIKTKI